MRRTLAVLAIGFSLSALNARADEFTKADTERWQKEYLNVVAEGRALWTERHARNQWRRLRAMPSQRRQHASRDLPEIPKAIGQGRAAVRDGELVP